MATKDEKKKLFDETLKSINKQKLFAGLHGDKMIATLGERPMNVKTISTGSLVLDHILGGGFGQGRVVEIYGGESSGKTSIALTAVGNVQKLGGNAVFIDVENALDPVYAKKLGVDIENLAVAQPSTAEQVMDLVQALTESEVVDIIVVDSVASMTPKRELEGNSEDLTIGELARLLSKQLRKLVGPASKTGTTVLFINQTRDQIGVFSPYGTPVTTPGGKALKFYASQRVKINKGKPVMEGNNAIGTSITFKVEKNKIAPPFSKGETVLTYNKGVNVAAELILVGKEYGVITMPNNRTYIETATGEIIGKSKAEALEKLEEDVEMLERLKVNLAHVLEENRKGNNADNNITISDDSDVEDEESYDLDEAEEDDVEDDEEDLDETEE